MNSGFIHSKNRANFLYNFIKFPRSVGAILPSSNRLARKIIRNIDFEKSKYIVEYGPGTGAFTSEIVKQLHKDTKLVCIELNKDFYNQLQQRYKDNENVIIINDSAENISQHLLNIGIEKVDYIVSGLPFASLPAELSESIFKETKKILSSGGTFNTFQYSPLKFKKFKDHFDYEIAFEPFNMFPAFVLYCSLSNGK